VTVRPATFADRDAIERLLAESELTTHALPDWIDRFWVAEQDGRIAGVAGIELYADGCLLRSVAVRPELRGTGLGRRLVERALEAARESGARRAYLLTLTAERWFPRLGFTTITRDEVPASVRESGEFKEACPASAMVMTKPLDASSA
jgi:amino-acid N-acetyltransferase